MLQDSRYVRPVQRSLSGYRALAEAQKLSNSNISHSRSVQQHMPG